MDLAAYELWIFALTSGLALLALPWAAERRIGPLIAFSGFAMIQTAAVSAPIAFGWQVGHWNWTGKVVAIGVSLAAVAALRLTRVEVGLVMPRGRRGWAVSAAGAGLSALLFLLLSLVLGPDSRPDGETLAFQATMPGLDEELAFRGIGMALLARGLPRGRFGLPTWALPSAMTSLWFTAVHVVNLEHGHWGLIPLAIVPVLPLGVLLALIRVGSGSLLGCVLAHNAANLTAKIAAFLLPPQG